jgi:formamidopyrimidine-DNA glycosylase
MPELPEVETIVSDLRPRLEGRHIENVDFLWHNTLQYPSPEEFDKSIAGRKIESLGRRGKYILVNLDHRDKNILMVMHLRMTGSLLWQTGDDLPRFTRTVIHLKEGDTLCFLDPRKFGKVMLGPSCPDVDRLGIEPFDKGFTPDYLASLTCKRKTPIKTLILDQSLIAGIGNMYADEALYDSRIDPERAADSLTDSELAKLRDSIVKVLKKGIEAHGASVSDYFRPNGERGHAHEGYKVAHNKDGVCECCGGKVMRKVVGQRGTYFCPNCQK